MCGRYTLVRLAELPGLFPWIKTPPTDLPSRYNIAPTQPLLAVANDHSDRYDYLMWGLVPPWAKDISIGNRMINARAETLGEKGAFRHAFRYRRCLIPADGFYEWKKSPDGKSKRPMYVRMKDGKPFAFAGLWESWSAPDGSTLRSCTIITTRPNQLMSSLHDRMPVILPRESQEKWLDPNPRSPEELNELLEPYADGGLEAGPVSKLVNSPKNDTPDCIAPPDEEPPGEKPPGGEPTLF